MGAQQSAAPTARETSRETSRDDYYTEEEELLQKQTTTTSTTATLGGSSAVSREASRDNSGSNSVNVYTSSPKRTTKDGPTPLPKDKMAAIFLICFSNACLATTPFPFLAFMVQDLGYSVYDTAVYAGFIASARFFGNLLTAWVWGYLSDTYGRRPVLIAGVAFQAVFAVVFGLGCSVSLYAAIFARFLEGMLNGSVPVAKTYVAEFADDSNQAAAMSMTTMAWGSGMVLGPAVGGYLSQPAEKYPMFDIPFFQQYKYALPMFFVACISITTLILTFLYLEETLQKEKGKKEKQRLEVFVEKDGRRTLTAPAHATVIYAVLSFQAIGMDELYNVWCATPRELGGMQWKSDQIGSSLLCVGLMIMISQPYFYPKLERRFGSRMTAQYAGVFSLVMLLVLPFFSRFEIDRSSGELWDVLKWTLFVVSFGFYKVCNSTCFVSSAIFINNSVKKHHRGSLNGFSMTCAALVRTLTPPIIGGIFSWSLRHSTYPINYHLAFIVCAFVNLQVAQLAASLPKEIEKQI
eukprot:m.74714 g.74714  ORF g.74714 m.74714 type:complete len:521 (-) comp12476_c0_seq1:109-1671(-)